MRIPFVDLKAQLAPIREEIQTAITAVIESQAFILGAVVERFETAFAAYLDCPHVVGLNSGTDALLIALKCLGVGSGDEVITPANGFYAAAEAILHAGTTPVFVDVDPQDALIDVEQIAARITPRTKAILPVHLYGQPADMDPIMAIARQHGLFVVEDACQAHGARYKGRMAGTVGDVGCFSFYPGKNLGAFGDGGALVTRDPRVAEMARKLRDHGGIQKYQHDLVGYNSRLAGIQAAVLNVKLRYLDDWNARRTQWARRYREGLAGLPWATPFTIHGDRTSNHHLFVVRVPPGQRAAIQHHLMARGITTGIHYPCPLHALLATQGVPHGGSECPFAEQLSQTILSLPMYAELTPALVDEVIDGLRTFRP